MLVGIDVSASRGFDLCALDEKRRVALVVKARDLETLEPIIRQFPKTTTFAVDASSAPSRGLLAGKEHRVAEHELRRLGITLYFTPRTEDAAPAWMREGFALFRLLDDAGFPVFRGGEAGTGLTIEVYPHLSYVSVSGTRRGAASKLEWSRAALRGRVSGIPSSADQDVLDAACAALTAWHFVQGQWVAYGDASEGLIVAPPPKRELGRIEGAGADQLAFPIEASSAPRALRPTHISTFVERVASVVKQIPAGRVATYGDIARWAGKPAGARAVGTILKTRQFELPCHRVIGLTGEPPPYPPDSLERLRAEGVPLVGTRVDVAAARWKGPA